MKLSLAHTQNVKHTKYKLLKWIKNFLQKVDVVSDKPKCIHTNEKTDSVTMKLLTNCIVAYERNSLEINSGNKSTDV